MKGSRGSFARSHEPGCLLFQDGRGGSIALDSEIGRVACWLSYGTVSLKKKKRDAGGFGSVHCLWSVYTVLGECR